MGASTDASTQLPKWTAVDLNEYLYVTAADIQPGRKTRVFTIHNTRTGEALGVVKWFSVWRQYTFYPAAGTIYNPACLADIGEFCQSATDGHKRGIV